MIASWRESRSRGRRSNPISATISALIRCTSAGMEEMVQSVHRRSSRLRDVARRSRASRTSASNYNGDQSEKSTPHVFGIHAKAADAGAVPRVAGGVELEMCAGAG
eukprot:5461296-Pleurochrysis_carterae.AAC.1